MWKKIIFKCQDFKYMYKTNYMAYKSKICTNFTLHCIWLWYYICIFSYQIWKSKVFYTIQYIISILLTWLLYKYMHIVYPKKNSSSSSRSLYISIHFYYKERNRLQTRMLVWRHIPVCKTGFFHLPMFCIFLMYKMLQDLLKYKIYS